MPEQERVEQSSAKYAAAIGISLLLLYGTTAALWAFAAEDPQEIAMVTSVE